MAQSDCYAANRTTSTIQLTPTESQIMAAMGRWLGTVLPPGWAITQGQQNRTPPPKPPFAVMQIITRKRRSTNSHIYSDQSVTLVQSLLLGVQITLFGPGAGDGVVQLNTAWRDPDAVAFFRTALPQAAPLYSSDPRQHAFTTAEKQYEDTWSLDLTLNVNASITRTAESATELSITAPHIVGADRLYNEIDR